MTSLFNPLDPSLYDNSYLFAQAIPTPLEGARVKASLDNVSISMQNLSLSIHSSSEGLRSAFGEEVERLSGVLSEIKSGLEGKSVDATIVPSIKKLVKVTTGIESNCQIIDAAISTLSDNLNRSMDEIKIGLRVQAVREQLMAKKIDQLESRLQQRENISGGGEMLKALEEMERRLLGRIGEIRGDSAMMGRNVGFRDRKTELVVLTPATTPQHLEESKQQPNLSSTATDLSPLSYLSSTIHRESVRTLSTSDNDSSGRNGLSRTTSKKRKIEQSQSEAEPDTEDDEPRAPISQSAGMVEPDTEDDEPVEEKARAESDGGEFDPDNDPAGL